MAARTSIFHLRKATKLFRDWVGKVFRCVASLFYSVFASHKTISQVGEKHLKINCLRSIVELSKNFAVVVISLHSRRSFDNKSARMMMFTKPSQKKELHEKQKKKIYSNEISVIMELWSEGKVFPLEGGKFVEMYFGILRNGNDGCRSKPHLS